VRSPLSILGCDQPVELAEAIRADELLASAIVTYFVSAIDLPPTRTARG